MTLSSLVITVAPSSFINTPGATVPPRTGHGKMGSLDAYVRSESIKAATTHGSSILQYIQSKFEDFKARFESDFAEIIPVGHGAVATYPDRPYLKWKFEYETGDHDPEDTDRDNVVHFLDGCRGLYDFFYDFAQLNPDIQDFIGPRAWDSIVTHVENILRKEGTKDERIRAWKEAISSGMFCHVSPTDEQVKYDQRLLKLSKAENQPHALTFHKAAWRHRNYILYELLPEIGLLL